MKDTVYRSEVRVERVKGPLRRAFLPAEKEPVAFGVHGAITVATEVRVPVRREVIAGAGAAPHRSTETRRRQTPPSRASIFRAKVDEGFPCL